MELLFLTKVFLHYRLCNVTVTRLQVTQPLGGDFNSITLAVKMQSSKRTLRSNEIPVPPSGTLDIELQLTFSLQVSRPQLALL